MKLKNNLKMPELKFPMKKKKKKKKLENYKYLNQMKNLLALLKDLLEP